MRIRVGPAWSCSAALFSVVHNVTILYILTHCISILMAGIFCKCVVSAFSCLYILDNTFPAVSQGNLEEGVM